MPPARKPDQSAPRTVSPTGVGYEGPTEGRDPRAQAGDALTTPNGVRIPDSDHSLKGGPARAGPAAGLPPAGEDSNTTNEVNRAAGNESPTSSSPTSRSTSSARCEALCFAHPLDLEAEGDVVDHAPVGEEAEVLEDHRRGVAPERAELSGSQPVTSRPSISTPSQTSARSVGSACGQASTCRSPRGP